MTSTGSPFWSGPKKCPSPLVWSSDDEMHIDFVEAAANLKAEIYGIEKNKDRAVIRSIVAKVNVPAFEPKSGVKIAVTDAEAQAQAQGGEMSDSDTLNNLLSEIPAPEAFKKEKLRITPCEFEKDDDTNGHIDFIVACRQVPLTNCCLFSVIILN